MAVLTVTPFAGRELDSVDGAALEANLAFLVRRGARLLVAGGNTAEFATLTPAERLEVVRVHVAAGAGGVRVLAGVGYQIDEAIELGRGALGLGATALFVHQPPVPYSTDRGLAEYYLRLARGLPDAPLILHLHNALLRPASLERVIRDAPTIVGVAVDVPELSYLADMRNAAPDIAWMCGVGEEFASEFWQAGAPGFTSGIANLLPTHSLAAFAELRLGRFSEAAGVINRVLPLERVSARHKAGNNVAVIKAAMDVLGLAGGGVRPPLSGLPPRERVELARLLRNLAE